MSSTVVAKSSPPSLSPRQEAALVAVADTLLPSLPNPTSADVDVEDDECSQAAAKESDAADRRYWSYKVSADPAYVAAVRTAILQKMAVRDRTVLQWLLSALATATGTSLVCGCFTATAFADCAPRDRLRLLQGLQRSRVALRRQAFCGLRRLLCGVAFSYYRTASTTSDSSKNSSNPFWEAMGFPGPPPWRDNNDDSDDNDDAARVAAAAERQRHVQKAVQESRDSIVIAAGESNNTTATPTAVEWDCDVAVVGSGAGGCVAAHALAQAGLDVVVVEKGAHLPPSEISLNESDAMDRQYEQHGLLPTIDGTVTILAGAGLGGGTAVNWGCCLPLPAAVRREWSTVFGLAQFESDEYEAATQHVLDKMGASDDDKGRVVHNAVNQKLMDACRKLGYPVAATGQSLHLSSSSIENKNAIESERLAAGCIGLGDRYGLKRGGGVQAFLEEACAQQQHKHNLRIVDQCRVDRVLYETATETTATDEKTGTITRPRATGVECTVLLRGDQQHQLTIRARRGVIVAAGALRTPCLLQQSGFGRSNRHIGRHLRLHPATGCIGLAPRRAPFVDSFRGAPMTTVSNQFAAGGEEDGDGYGCRIEVPVNTPGLSSVAVNWLTPTIYRQRLRRYRHWMPLLLLQRDSGDGGTVHADTHGNLVVHYRMQRRDRDSLVRALQGGAALLEQMGSEEIGTAHINDFGWKPGSATDRRSLSDYQESIRERGLQDHKLGLFSAHQMGTCRMSTSSKMGAVDPNGELWDCDNLFVMDASVFPTASGANPMTTIMSISYMLSRRLALRLRYEAENDDKNNKNKNTLSDEDRAEAQALVQQREEMRSSDYNEAEKRRVLGVLVRTVGVVALPVIAAIVVAKCVKKRET